MGPRLALVLAAACAVAGCAVPQGSKLVADGKADLSAAPICCSDLSTAIRQPLPTTAEPQRFVIDRSRQAFDFGGNKAFFVMFELPTYTQPYSIEVSSETSGSMADAALFIPRVAMYDAGFKPTRFFDEKTLRNRGQQLERTIFINPGDVAERYIVVFGSDLSASIERNYAIITATPVFAGPVMFNVVTGTEGKSVMRSSPTGQVQITVSGLTPPTR